MTLISANQTFAARVIAAFLLSVTAAGTAFAQATDYPQKPVTIIVPFTAGGATDISARKIAQLLTTQLGQSFVVENRVGASGMIGMSAVSRAAPDGYLLGWAVNTSVTVAPHLVKKPAYDPDTTKSFTPISLAAISSWVLSTRSGLPVNNMAELVALAKAQPGKLNFASSGTGSAPHLLGEMFKSAAGIDAVHVPFKGEAESLQAMLAGQIDFIFASSFASAPLLSAGKIKGLAVTTPQRDPSVPNIPTVTEVGIPDLTFEIFYGLMAPPGTPAPIVAKLASAMKQAVQDPSYKESMAKGGITATSTTPTEFSALLKRHNERWLSIIRRNNITPIDRAEGARST